MNEMALFEERPVRRVFHDEEWWFVLTDIVSALTRSPAPSDYLKKLRRLMNLWWRIHRIQIFFALQIECEGA